MHTPTVEFLFDFGSPNAYFCHKVIPGIEARTGVKFRYVPVLLGGLFKLANNRSPAEAFADIPKKSAYEQMEMERFIQKNGLTAYQRNSFFPVNTLAIMRGAVAAQRLNCLERYVDVIYAGMWEKSLNLSDVSIIGSALGNAGLDAPAILQSMQEQSVKDELLANTQNAYERGAFGSPFFFVGTEMFFGKDRLREVEDEIVLQSAGR